MRDHIKKASSMYMNRAWLLRLVDCWHKQTLSCKMSSMVTHLWMMALMQYVQGIFTVQGWVQTTTRPTQVRILKSAPQLECSPIRVSGVCRAKMQVFTPAGNFDTTRVAPGYMSSVPLAEGEMSHFRTADEEPKLVKGVGGIVSLKESDFLMFPHPIRGSTLVPAYAVSKEMIPKHNQILLSKSAVGALAIDLNLLSSQDAIVNVSDEKCSCSKLGRIVTHVVTSHA